MPSVHANRRSSAPSESRGRPVVLASLLLALLLGLVSAGAWWGGWFGVKEDPRLTEVKTVMAEAAAKYPPDQAPKNMLDTAARQKVVQLAEKLADDAPGLHVWVSFDGQQTALKTTNSRVRVTFSRAGSKADHDIMDLVAKDKTVDAPWFVVSDDIEVRDATAREGAYIIYNDALIQLLVNRGIRA